MPYVHIINNVTSNYILSFVFLLSFLHTTYTHFVLSPAVFLAPVFQAAPPLPVSARHFDVTWTGAKAKPIDLPRTYELLEEVGCGDWPSRDMTAVKCVFSALAGGGQE